MQIGAFVALLNTTKETVRHYEDLGLLTPARAANGRRLYGEREILNFKVIRELKALGLGLKEIQLLFELKAAYGCGDQRLIQEVTAQLSDHLAALRREEAELRQRIENLEGQLQLLQQVAGTPAP